MCVLQFEERLTQRQVAVVAHYRGGSTFASLMFSNYPNSLYVFEPASVFGAVWVGVNNSLARETERSRIFLERVCIWCIYSKHLFTRNNQIDKLLFKFLLMIC